MTDSQIKLVIGSLLHDIGKVVYRSGNGKNHSESGAEYLLEEAGIKDPVILNCVRYHHGNHLKNASIREDDYAYITYYADNIASALDRRVSEEGEDGFDKKVPLSSIFNILNGNHGHSHFQAQVLEMKNEMNWPSTEPVTMDESFYQKVIRNITENLRGIDCTEEYVNSLLAILEANLSYIPSSTSRRELADISLFDHLKITAAAALCIEQYLYEKNIKNYRSKLLDQGKESYAEKMFLLYSMDISGIQNFIYTIASKGALRSLRARSFYLEIMMEHIIDEILTSASLNRANLIYCGGGHCYMLLPNTERIREILEEKESELNRWLLHTFGTALYVAGGYAACSADDLKNEPSGSYAQLYRTVSRTIAEKKAHRYSAQEIIGLNRRKHAGERECEVCRTMAVTDENGRCPVCASLEMLSARILYNKFFTIVRKADKDALPLPFSCFLTADTKESLLDRMKTETYVRCYTKNEFYTGRHVTTKLWVGDYTTGDTFEEFAQKAAGIKRLGILRADVDNLGKAFISGFRQADGNDRLASLSRTAALSRHLSLFFKCYINTFLENGEANVLGAKRKRNVTIVYSGGDDVFLAGSWNDVIAAFIDLHNAFKRYTQGTLTISGGIGLYHSGYPVNMMAKETAELEERSKSLKEKNGITLFDEDGTYEWDRFLSRVLAKKYQVAYFFFSKSEEHGKAFLYHLLALLQNSSDQIQTVRYIYLLSRMEPDGDSSREQRENYRIFSEKMYEWIRNPEDRQELITAMYLYIYFTREEEME